MRRGLFILLIGFLPFIAHAQKSNLITKVQHIIKWFNEHK